MSEAFRNLSGTFLVALDRLWQHLQVPPQTFIVLVREPDDFEWWEEKELSDCPNNTDPPSKDRRIIAYEIELGTPTPHPRRVWRRRPYQAGTTDDWPRCAVSRESVVVGHKSYHLCNEQRRAA